MKQRVPRAKSYFMLLYTARLLLALAACVILLLAEWTQTLGLKGLWLGLVVLFCLGMFEKGGLQGSAFGLLAIRVLVLASQNTFAFVAGIWYDMGLEYLWSMGVFLLAVVEIIQFENALRAKLVCDHCHTDFEEGGPIYECKKCDTRYSAARSFNGSSDRCAICGGPGLKVAERGCARCGQGEPVWDKVHL